MLTQLGGTLFDMVIALYVFINQFAHTVEAVHVRQKVLGECATLLLVLKEVRRTAFYLAF